MLHLAKYLEKNVKTKAPLSRCLQTAKKEFVIQLLILYLFYLYIYPPDSQESNGGTNT